MRKKGTRLFEHNGEKRSIYGWAKEYHVSYTHLWTKITNGMTMDEALATIKPRKPVKKVMFRGKEYTLTQLSAKCGINRETLNKRIFFLGWDVEKACANPKQNRGQFVTPLSDRAWCKRYDCLYQDGSGKCQLGVRKDREICDKYYDAFEYYYGNEIKRTKRNAGKDPWEKERRTLLIG